MSELKCETDFVAKNEEFIALAEGIAKIALDKKTADIDGSARRSHGPDRPHRQDR
jgi:translation elongation factor EF-Ts